MCMYIYVNIYVCLHIKTLCHLNCYPSAACSQLFKICCASRKKSVADDTQKKIMKSAKKPKERGNKVKSLSRALLFFLHSEDKSNFLTALKASLFGMRPSRWEGSKFHILLCEKSLLANFINTHIFFMAKPFLYISPAESSRAVVAKSVAKSV